MYRPRNTGQDGEVTEMPLDNVLEDLRQHLILGQEILAVVEREGQALRHAQGDALAPISALKKNLMPRLTQSVHRLRQHRLRWQQLAAAERAQHAGIAPLLRQNQDLIMKIIVLDRENEQTLLRLGLLPADQLPPAQRQQGHFVADLYRRQGGKE
jgi:hypothetical protein